TFCCGCGAYVFSGELTWVETGEVVLDYMGRLRAEHLARELGTSPSDLLRRPVVVTPRAARALARLAAGQGLKGRYYLALSSSRAGLEVHYAWTWRRTGTGSARPSGSSGASGSWSPGTRRKPSPGRSWTTARGRKPASRSAGCTRRPREPSGARHSGP